MADVHLFVIRVWRQFNRFRASVRAVDEEVPRYFEQPEDVGEFLRRAADAAPAAEPAPPAASST